MSNDTEKQYHFFTSSALLWNTDASLPKVIERQERLDKANNRRSSFKVTKYAIYKVPLPVSSTYEIDNYMPCVEGTELIDIVEY